MPLKLAIYYIWTQCEAQRKIPLRHTSKAKLKNFEDIL